MVKVALVLSACLAGHVSGLSVDHMHHDRMIRSIVAEAVQGMDITTGATPKVASQFAGSVTQRTGSTLDILQAYQVYDEINKMQVSVWSEAVPFKGVAPLNVATFLLPNASFLEISDRCQPLPEDDKFAPAFPWLPVADNKGPIVVDGRTCDLYTLDVPTKGISLALCLENTSSIPVLWNTTTPLYNMSYIYGADVHEGLNATDKTLEKVPASCYESPPICSGGKVEEMEAYIFHPANKFDIYNEDVADLLGDTAFICADAETGHTEQDAYQWVSLYKLQMWSGWGDYAECNRPTPDQEGVCISFEKYAVGREASYALKPHGGQCVNNSDTGSWYSLPKAGMCQNATQPLGPEGDGHCSWRIVEKIKTINGTCLLKDRGMLQSCVDEASFPFTKTQAILKNAFDSDTPSSGGCPDISP